MTLKEKNPPFRITIEHWNKKVTVETDHSDVDINELADLLNAVLLVAGWNQDTIDEILVK